MTNENRQLLVTVIGGYLGSGKTTLVNHLLRNANGRRLAVLVNEFGELAIDEDLIEAADDDVISIAGGCICCSFGNDLAATMMDLSKMSPAPDHILIESSGVAIPSAIVATMSLLDGFRADGVIVVTDAETLRKNAADDYIGDTIMRQLADADIVIVNKRDLVSEAMLQSLEYWLAQAAPRASVIEARHGQVPLDALLGSRGPALSETRWEHADRLFDSFVLLPSDAVEAEALAELLATGPFGVVRAKGFWAGADGNCNLIHVVGQRWDCSPAGGSHPSGVVVIGKAGQLDHAGIEAATVSMASALRRGLRA